MTLRRIKGRTHADGQRKLYSCEVQADEIAESEKRAPCYCRLLRMNQEELTQLISIIDKQNQVIFRWFTETRIGIEKPGLKQDVKETDPLPKNGISKNRRNEMTDTMWRKQKIE